MRLKRVRPAKAAGGRAAAQPAPGRLLRPADFDGVLEKLKLLEFGLFGLQQLGRRGAMDAEDIGPFTRLAEEIESDVLELQRRLLPPSSAPAGGERRA